MQLRASLAQSHFIGRKNEEIPKIDPRCMPFNQDFHRSSFDFLVRIVAREMTWPYPSDAKILSRLEYDHRDSSTSGGTCNVLLTDFPLYL